MAHVLGKPLFDGRLTKQALLTLPVGAFLVSNCLFDSHTPQIAEHVPSDAEARARSWKKLRAMKLSGTKFYAFTSATEYRVWSRFQNGRPTIEAMQTT